MNQIYTGEKKSISIFNEGPSTKGPSDMVIQNILSYSAALKVEKTKNKNAIKLETIQVILN